MKFTSFLCGAAATLLLAVGCNRSESEWQQAEGMIWNTSYHITYDAPKNLNDSIIPVLNEVGGSLSIFDPNSLVNIVNKQDSTPVDSHFIRVYVMSRKIGKLSGGMFDPTVSPLVTAWGFGPGHKATSDTLRIDSLLQFVGIDKTRLQFDALIKDDPRIQFNFSAIAKGYGCDAVADMLKRHGSRNHLVEIGGEITACGVNPQGEKWRVSVDRPIFSDSVIHDSQVVVAFTDMGMATSGNYRNFHTANGKRYGHTLSPLTGRPATTDILSATVIAPTAMEADGLSTAMMSLGSERAMALAKQLRRAVLLVLADGEVWMSPQFKALVVDSPKK